MSRRIKKHKTTIDLKKIINESILEVFDSKIQTSFKEVNYGKYIAYEFKTSSGTSYDLEFHYSDEHGDTPLSGGKTLKEVLNTDEDLIDCFDIAFTLSFVKDKDNPDEFEIDSNKHEQFELFGRIAYIIDKLSKKYKQTRLFVIGPARRNRLDIYKKIFENIFSKNFDLYLGKSQHHYLNESLFIIRKR